MNLLQRLIEADLGTGVGGTGDVDAQAPRFFASRRFLWELSLDSDGRPIEGGLAVVRDAADSKGRGAAHQAPSLKRANGIAPLLGADDIQYVLGWADEKARPDRVRRCLEAFAAAVEDWATRYPGDPMAQAVATFYREERYNEVLARDRWTSKDPVFITVDDVPVMTNPSLQETWAAQALARKGGGTDNEDAHCLVCGQRGSVLHRLPQGIPKNLVPGASQEVAMLSANLPIFGHTFTTGLSSSPICDQCGEKAVTALRTMAGRAGGKAVGANDRYGTLHHPGQRTRLVWWTLGRDFELDQALEGVQADVIEQLYKSVREGGGWFGDAIGDRFCAVTFSGSSARLAIKHWVDRPLVEIESNIVDWFDDHAIEPFRQEHGTYVGIYRLFLALGRWEPDRTTDQRHLGRYSVPRRSGNDPHRPPDAQTHLIDAALLGRPLPLAMMLHLINRIRADGHIDQPRAALLRLFLNRHVHSTSRHADHRETIVPEPGLDETYDDPSYLAGRIMAVLGRIQYTATRSREGRSKGGSLNTTFEDRYLAGAISNPQIAIVQGRQQSAAWLRKLRQTRPAAATVLSGQLHDLFARYPAREGLPGRSTSVEQTAFILGYHQQRAHDIRKAREQKEKSGHADIGDLPELDEPIDNDNTEDQSDEGGNDD